MTWPIYLAVFAVMLVASTVASSVGFGSGLIAAPMLRILHAELLPGPLVASGVVIAIGLVVRNTRRSDIPIVAPALVGRFIGILIAISMLLVLSERGLTIAIGVTVLSLVALRFLNVTIALTTPNVVGVGIASGIGGAIASLGGAPMALAYGQHNEARDFRGPMGAYMAIGGIVTVVLLVIAGQFAMDDVVPAVLLLPPVLLGLVLARWVTPVVDRGLLRPLVLGLSSVSAVALILGELL